MKYLGLILVVALVAGQVLARRINENDSQLEHSRVKRGLNEKFHNFLVKLKDTLREGNETLGIPKLDPFEADLLEMKLEQLVKGNVELADLKVEGISEYRIDAAKISILPAKITIGLSWPRIHASGLYKFAITAVKEEIEAFGEGEFDLTLTELTFHSIVSLGIVGGVKIKKMETVISLGGLALSATGLLGDEDTSAILCEIISDMAPQLLEDYHDEVTKILNEKVIEFANKKLDGMSLSDILGLIN